MTKMRNILNSKILPCIMILMMAAAVFAPAVAAHTETDDEYKAAMEDLAPLRAAFNEADEAAKAAETPAAALKAEADEAERIAAQAETAYNQAKENKDAAKAAWDAAVSDESQKSQELSDAVLALSLKQGALTVATGVYQQDIIYADKVIQAMNDSLTMTWQPWAIEHGLSNSGGTVIVAERDRFQEWLKNQGYTPDGYPYCGLYQLWQCANNNSSAIIAGTNSLKASLQAEVDAYAASIGIPELEAAVAQAQQAYNAANALSAQMEEAYNLAAGSADTAYNEWQQKLLDAAAKRDEADAALQSSSGLRAEANEKYAAFKDGLEAAEALYDMAVIKDFGETTGGEVSAHINAPYAGFTALYLGDKPVPPECYLLEEGSTNITLSAGYIGTLADGSYEYTARFLTEGLGERNAMLHLTVRRNNPKTGDTGLWLMTALLVSLAGIILIRRKNRQKRMV